MNEFFFIDGRSHEKFATLTEAVAERRRAQKEYLAIMKGSQAQEPVTVRPLVVSMVEDSRVIGSIRARVTLSGVENDKFARYEVVLTLAAEDQLYQILQIRRA